MAEPVDRSTILQRCLDRLKAGDLAARDELLAIAVDRLDRLARKLLHADPRVRRWEQTDDVRQNAMLRLHKAMSAVTPETPRDFFRLAALHIRRTLIDMARHYYGPEGGAARHASAGATAAEHGVESSPAEMLDWAEFHAAVERLPDDEREVFDLLWYHELSQEEAAGVLGVPLRTLQRRWRSARLALGDALPGS